MQKKVQKWLVECENALERVRETTQSAEFIYQNWECLDYSVQVPSRGENTEHCSSLILKRAPQQESLTGSWSQADSNWKMAQILKRE